MLMLFDVGASLESEKNAIQTTKRGKRAVEVIFNLQRLLGHIYILCSLIQFSQTTKTTMVCLLKG